jgi:hypothetical protein
VSRKALGLIQPPIQWVPGALSLGVNRPGREANNSPPSSAEVNNAWSYTSTPPMSTLSFYKRGIETVERMTLRSNECVLGGKMKRVDMETMHVVFIVRDCVSLADMSSTHSTKSN